MVQIIEYIFKTDTKGNKKAVRHDTRTGDKTPIDYQLARKRQADNKYRRERNLIERKIIESGSGGTWAEYKKMSVIVARETKDRRAAGGYKPATPAVLRGMVKKNVIENRLGIATRLRFAWVYSVVLDRYINPETGKLVADCDTSIFVARALKRNGDEFTNMVGVCQKKYDEINNLDLCTLNGGACVVLYRKSDKETLEMFELGKGCGFSFDFTNYNENADISDNDDGFNNI